MDIQFNSRRKLSHGALKILNNFSIKEDKRIFYANFILQIYKCFPLGHNSDLFSCEVFDDEYLCQNFIIIYNINEGRPYNGDIISITKIIINILPYGNVVFCCEEIKLLEKSAQYLINPENLKIISNKPKKNTLNNSQDSNYNNNNSLKKENKIENYNIVNNKEEEDIIKKGNNEINNNIENRNILENIQENIKYKDSEINEIEEIIIENDIIEKKEEENNNKIIEEKEEKKINNEEIILENKVENKKNQTNEFKKNLFENKKEEEFNKNINEKDSQINDNLKIKEKILNSTILEKSKKNSIKIKTQKRDAFFGSKSKDILESINLFKDDFQDGENIDFQINNNNIIDNQFLMLESKIEQNDENTINLSSNIGEICKKINENKNDKCLKLYNSKFDKFNIIIKDGLNIKYIKEVKEFLKHSHKTNNNLNIKLKCRIKNFHHSYDNFYKGCSICHKKINNNGVCCKNGKEILLYNFFFEVRDASSVKTVFFFDKVGRKLMGINAETYKKYLDNKQPIGQILFYEYTNDFYEHEYIFTVNIQEIKYKNKNKSKYKYLVTDVEKVNKTHRYQMVKELKNIMGIN